MQCRHQAVIPFTVKEGRPQKPQSQICPKVFGGFKYFLVLNYVTAGINMQTPGSDQLTRGSSKHSTHPAAGVVFNSCVIHMSHHWERILQIGLMIRHCTTYSVRVQGVFFNWDPPKSSKCQIPLKILTLRTFLMGFTM